MNRTLMRYAAPARAQATSPENRIRSQKRSGFTMLEVMVSIGIILLLTGLTFTAAASVNRQAEIRQTKTTLELLDMAVQQWQVNAGRNLTWMDFHDDDPTRAVIPLVSAEMTWKTPENLLITEMLDVVSRDPAARSILKQIDSEFIHVFAASAEPRWASPQENAVVNARFIGSMSVIDPWGNPIYATHPGRIRFERNFWYDQYRQSDADGTIRTYNESKYGVAVNRRMCFVSAGPDGQFGFLGSPPESPDFKATEDNLYSYSPQRP